MAPGTYTSHATHRMLELDGLPLASFRRRAIAFVIDFLLMSVVSALLIIAGAKLAQRWGWVPADVHLELKFNYTNWYSIVAIVLYFGLATFLGNGRTVGKMFTRIRVVSTIHPRISLFHSFERALGYTVSAAELGFGFIQYFIADNRQTTHDRIAGTIVIQKPTKAQVDALSKSPAAPEHD